MANGQLRRTRPIDALGWLCLVATLLSTSFVVAVRAGGSEEAMMSVDPALVAPAAPPSPPAEAPTPRIVHLNTRGYNYGPAPGALDEAAMRFERLVRPETPPSPPSPPR